MTTSQLVTHLLRFSGETVSRAEMLSIINYCQNEILAIDSSLTRTKPDPNLVTTSGDYDYTLAQNVRSVRRVYVDLGINNSYGAELRDFWNDGGWSRNKDQIREVPVMTVPSTSPTAASANRAQVKWPTTDDPGSTTTTYLLEQYEWPTQVTAESIAMTLPEEWFFNLLKPRVLMELEGQEYGNDISWDDKFEKGMKKFRSWANTSRTMDKNTIQYREL